MKPSKNKIFGYLFQPYLLLDGWRALGWGLGIQLLAVLFAYLLSGRYDGFLDYHFGDDIRLRQVLVDQVVNMSILLLVFGGAVLLIGGGRNRWIDIVGLLLLARAPVIMLPLLNLGDYFRQLSPQLLSDEGALSRLPTAAESIMLLLFSLISLAVLVWWLVLLFQVFRLLIHKSGIAFTFLFIALVVLAEYLSKMLILFFNS